MLSNIDGELKPTVLLCLVLAIPFSNSRESASSAHYSSEDGPGFLLQSLLAFYFCSYKINLSLYIQWACSWHSKRETLSKSSMYFNSTLSVKDILYWYSHVNTTHSKIYWESVTSSSLCWTFRGYEPVTVVTRKLLYLVQALATPAPSFGRVTFKSKVCQLRWWVVVLTCMGWATFCISNLFF